VGTGYRGPEGALVWMEEKKVFDPEAVYGDAPNPTRL
jgi:hypothetical protein